MHESTEPRWLLQGELAVDERLEQSDALAGTFGDQDRNPGFHHDAFGFAAQSRMLADWLCPRLPITTRSIGSDSARRLTDSATLTPSTRTGSTSTAAVSRGQ